MSQEGRYELLARQYKDLRAVYDRLKMEHTLLISRHRELQREHNAVKARLEEVSREKGWLHDRLSSLNERYRELSTNCLTLQRKNQEYTAIFEKIYEIVTEILGKETLKRADLGPE